MLINESETLSSENIEYLISFNKRRVKKRGELFEVDKDYIDKLPNKIDSYNVIKDKRQRIIKKATRILAGITYYQPFGDGNKETAHYMTIRFLKRNGFKLLNTSETRKEIYDLLIRTILKPTNDPTIFSEVEEYITKKIRLL
ncbi:hypothetical protein BH18THE2_BH18THE2_37970 [soil metagenome]